MSLAEVGDRLVIRRQPADQPHHFHIAPGLPLEPTARLNPVEIAVDVELQQIARMIGRPAGRQRLDPVEPEAAKIELIDEDVDRPNRVVVADPVFQALRKQRALAAIDTLDKTLHQTLPPKHERIITPSTFLHSLGQKQTSSEPIFDVRFGAVSRLWAVMFPEHKAETCGDGCKVRRNGKPTQIPYRYLMRDRDRARARGRVERPF